jgi:hypothetical protein
MMRSNAACIVLVRYTGKIEVRNARYVFYLSALRSSKSLSSLAIGLLY